jgi:hypothetical protein
MPGISNVISYQYNRIYVLQYDLPTYLLNESGPLAVYAIAMIKLIILNQAPSYIYINSMGKECIEGNFTDL